MTNLQNEGAWADLGKELNEPDAADDGEENAEADNLWDEFKSREQEEEQRVSLPASTVDVLILCNAAQRHEVSSA